MLDEARGEVELGWADQPIGMPGRPTRARSGPTLVSMVLVPLLSKIHDFHDWISFHCHGVLPSHSFPIYLYAQHVETNTYTKE
jgi:hypothetical protein